MMSNASLLPNPTPRPPPPSCRRLYPHPTPHPPHMQDNLAVMSIGFLLPNPDDAVIWRGPRKNGLIKQFLKDVHWGPLDYLIIDSPPGTSDEHISIVQVCIAF